MATITLNTPGLFRNRPNPVALARPAEAPCPAETRALAMDLVWLLAPVVLGIAVLAGMMLVMG